MGRIKLFCLPYAGGSATIFTKWRDILPCVEVVPVELAGRGIKFSIPLNDSIAEEVNYIFKEISDSLKESKYAFFGHSLGTLLIYELLNKIESENIQPPVHVFMSGRYPPHVSNGEKPHMLSDEEFKKKLLNMGGTPQTVLENKELIDIFLPILKSDFRKAEQYVPTEGYPKWNFDISVLYGQEDQTYSCGVRQWERYTSKSCKFYEFPGGHFFIHSEESKVIELINKTFINSGKEGIGCGTIKS